MLWTGLLERLSPLTLMCSPEAQVIVIVDAEVMGYGPAVGAPKQYRDWPPQGANGRSSGTASYSNPSSRGQQQG